tara:strand:- start:1528 stop:2220 length:693 start_codon:yes stop_codon:yes gene_type:complete
MNNVFLGVNSANNIHTGSDNVYIGANTGEYSLVSSKSTYIGPNAGQYCMGGENNIFIGYNSGQMAEHNDCIIIGDYRRTPYDEYLSFANIIEGANIYHEDSSLRYINIKGRVLIDGVTEVRNLIAKEEIPQVLELKTKINSDLLDIYSQISNIENNVATIKFDETDYGNITSTGNVDSGWSVTANKIIEDLEEVKTTIIENNLQTNKNTLALLNIILSNRSELEAIKSLL